MVSRWSRRLPRRSRSRRRGHGDIGAAIGLGIGAAILGGVIAAEGARQQDAIGYCMRRFRSYDPVSMTYLGLDGLAIPVRDGSNTDQVLSGPRPRAGVFASARLAGRFCIGDRSSGPNPAGLH